MIRTAATMFGGIEGAGIGTRIAGYEHLWSIEKNPQYSAIAKANGFNSITADVRKFDYKTLESPYLLHCSPPCQNASAANRRSKETPTDIDLASSCLDAVEALEPNVITLENVDGYRTFESFKMIVLQLRAMGYFVQHSIVDSAKFGTAQNRRRLWMVARRDQYGVMPLPTHGNVCQDEQLGLFQDVKPLVGWQEAIAGLPEPPIYKVSQYPRLKGKLDALKPTLEAGQSYLVAGWEHDHANKILTARLPHEPASTLLAGRNRPSTIHKIVKVTKDRRTYTRVLGVQHAAALQGFPTSYKFDISTAGNRARCYEGIGNSVTPQIMAAIALSNA